MQPPVSQPTINVCSKIKCPFFEIKPNSGRCSRYSNTCQCHLSTVASVKSDGYWLLASNENDFEQLKKANDRFLAKDKASQKQLKQLTMQISQSKLDKLDRKVSSIKEVELPTGG